MVPEAEEELPATRTEYYAALEPQEREDTQEKVVLLTNGDVYNGLYGAALQRAGTDATQYTKPLARAGIVATAATRQARVKETSREPPVQTIRNYSKVNDDGSFTFGYEAADGSFKEETRGTDCVVRGKYGYVDPDGNKREFTYVSGNPCDPNAPQEEEKESSEESGEENVPQNLPKRPIVPIRTSRPVARPATTLFQQNFQTDTTVEQEEQPQVYLQPTPVRARLPARPITVAPQKATSVVRVTPRPATTAAPTNLPATTYRPQLLVSVTPRPNVVYTKHSSLARPSPSPASPTSSVGSSLDFDAELKRFQLENNVVSTPRPASPSTTVKTDLPTGQPIYTSELVYDPTSGQYNTVVYQQLSKTPGDLTLKARLPQYVEPQRPIITQQPSALIQQQLFQQQKQALFQQSQDLYNQQRQQLQAQHRFQPFTPTAVQYQPSSTVTPTPTKAVTNPQKLQSSDQSRRVIERPVEPQQFYYFAPQLDAQSQALSSGQIDAFLKGHNFQF